MEAEDAHILQEKCFRYCAKPHDIPATQVEQQLRQDKEDAEEAEDARVAQAEIDAATPRRRAPQVHFCPNKERSLIVIHYCRLVSGAPSHRPTEAWQQGLGFTLKPKPKTLNQQPR